MNGYGGHPERKTIAAYLARTCGAADTLWLDEHLQCCTPCYQILAAERLPVLRRLDFAVSAVPFPVRVREPSGIGPARRSGITQLMTGKLVRKLRLPGRVPQPRIGL